MTLTESPVSHRASQAAPPAAAYPGGMPEPARAPAWRGPVPAEELVALAVRAASDDPGIAADRLYAAAEGSRDRLLAATSLLIDRLKRHCADFEATLALQILERALVRTPYPDGPWRWADNLSPRRVRAAKRRRRRALRRRSGPGLPDRAAWWQRRPARGPG